MIPKREFIFGGLKVEIYVHPEFGSVTTTKEFADIVGVAKRSVNRLLVQHGLLEEKLAAEDDYFGTELSRNNRVGKQGRHSNVLLTVRGMIFLTMLLRTEKALAFKNEVLHTIEMLEGKGYTDWAAVEARLESKIDDVIAQNKHLLVIVEALTKENRELKADIASIKDENRILKETNDSLWKAGKHESSAAGHMMNAAKVRKKATGNVAS